MASLPTGVTIVATSGDDGPAGATANAVSSLSIEPMLMLACLDRGSRTLLAVQAADRFSVSVLHDGQEGVARSFAGRRWLLKSVDEARERELLREISPVLARLLALRGVHPTVEAARGALLEVLALPLPEKPAKRRSLRTWYRSIYVLLIFGGFDTTRNQLGLSFHSGRSTLALMQDTAIGR